MQYIPGPEEILAPALTQLMDGINHAIDPDFKMREAVKAQLAVNPELLQNLADAEAKTPGTMAQLGLGKLGDTISKVSPSIRAANEIQNRSAEIAAKAAATKSQTAIDTLKGGLATAGNETLATDKTAQKEAGSIAATGMPTWERATGEQKAAYQATVKKMIAEGPQVTLQKFKEGKYTNEEMAAIFDSPLGNALKLNAELEMERSRRVMASAQLRADSAMSRLLAAQAFQMYQDTHTASPEAFMKLLNGGTQEAKSLLGKDKSTLTPEQRNLVDAYEGIQLLGTRERAKFSDDEGKKLMAAVQGFKNIKKTDNDPDGARALAASAVDQILSNRAELLQAPKYTAEYDSKGDKRPWYERDQPAIIYKDAKGRIVPEAQALAGMTMAPTFQEKVGQAFHMVKSVAGDPTRMKAALEEIRAADASVASAVDRLIARGELTKVNP